MGGILFTIKMFKRIGLCSFGSMSFLNIGKTFNDYDKKLYYEKKYTVMDGKTFRRLFPNFVPYKIIGNNRNDFSYRIGTIKNTEKFNPNGFCEGGGLYFCDLSDLSKYIWADYGNQVATLELLDDEPIYLEDSKCKTNKFKITHIDTIYDFFSKQTKETLMSFVENDWNSLKFIPDELKTPEMCMKAVKSNACALQYIPDELKTQEICMEAIKLYACTLCYVPEKFKTQEMCMKAIKSDGRALKYVPKELKTPEMCICAVKSHGLALFGVPEELKTFEMCMDAVKSDGSALDYVPEKLKTYEMCVIAVVESRGDALNYVPDEYKTSEMIDCANESRNRSYLWDI